jgi:RNA polymerase sigma factor (sigma-70 family)
MSNAEKCVSGMRQPLSDEELLTADDPEAFGVFYARHLPSVERFFARRVSGQAACDLAAETFAAAFEARRRFVPGKAPATAWLFTIAARRLIDCRRRGAVEQRSLERLALDLHTAAAGTGESVSATAREINDGYLRHLPREQRLAIVAHLFCDLGYAEIAAQAATSEQSVRQRVSRGLSALREPLRVYRAAHALASEDRRYAFGGGHLKDLRMIAPGEALDCSASASLILQRAGLFEAGSAWTSDRLASTWGRAGEGRHVTLWSNDTHVWFEFKLEDEPGERFDPTPARAFLGSTPSATLADAAEYTPRHWRGL